MKKGPNGPFFVFLNRREEAGSALLRMKEGKIRQETAGAPDREVHQFFSGHGTHPGAAPMVEDVFPPLLFKVLNGADGNVGGRGSETADGGGSHVFPQTLDELKMGKLSLAHDDFLENLMDVLRSVTAGGALSAGFMVVES